MSSADPFPEHRPNVGAVLFNSDGLVWMGRRADARGAWRWQFPQGGIDAGESPEDAGLRELREETGIDPHLVEFLAEIPGWIAYDYPPELVGMRPDKGRWKGQKQRWFAYRFLGSDSDFQLDRHADGDDLEFDQWRWERLEEAPGLIIPWKRDVYLRVVDAFSGYAAR